MNQEEAEKYRAEVRAKLEKEAQAKRDREQKAKIEAEEKARAARKPLKEQAVSEVKDLLFGKKKAS